VNAQLNEEQPTLVAGCSFPSLDPALAHQAADALGAGMPF
jgi:hypothetical protein